MLSDEDIDQVEAHYRGQLKDEALAAFEKKCAMDESFAKEVEVYTKIMAGLVLQGQEDFSKKVASWEDALEKEDGQIRYVKFKPLLGIAASVLIIILPLGFWWYMQSHLSTDALFEKYYHPYEDVISTRSSGNDESLMQAMADYNAADYAHAIPGFEKFYRKNQSVPIVGVYLGISHLAVGDSKKAEYYFRSIENEEDFFFRQIAAWYLALTYLKEQDIKAAELQLREIQKNDRHSFFKEATQLSADMERLK